MEFDRFYAWLSIIRPTKNRIPFPRSPDHIWPIVVRAPPHLAVDRSMNGGSTSSPGTRRPLLALKERAKLCTVLGNIKVVYALIEQTVTARLRLKFNSGENGVKPIGISRRKNPRRLNLCAIC